MSRPQAARRATLIFACFLFASTTLLTAAKPAPETKRHIVIVVWDGMRPDFVTPENTPALWKFAQEGVFFRNHHSVYPSATHVNGVALVTGVYPDHNGLTVNYDYRPDINSRKFVSTAQADVIRKGDKI